MTSSARGAQGKGIVVVKPPDYYEQYRKFVEAGDEKEVVAGVLGPLLGPGSILDVGAGCGDIPEILGLRTRDYTAIECHVQCVEVLRAKSLNVIEATFPCNLTRRYDNILLCYCLYGGRFQCEAILDAAWGALEEGGRIIVVTFRDHLDDYNRLLHRIGHTLRGHGDRYFAMILRKLESLAPVTRDVAHSSLYGRDLGELADVLSFMATNSNAGTVQRRGEIRETILAERPYLDGLYRTESGAYRFPIVHHVLVITKGMTMPREQSGSRGRVS
ncbi:hypothetical protein [Streptomyces sp. CAI-85]|uniref:hypothetical protein n=1 Tax=Streptomyces sp. CAI-85 TaxID=1472662 RepID=UPI001587297F|nr:hypothetical protein [Streptomyces sp. CAI-85]MBO7936731.1 hypothetical protein [Streptomyces sp. S9]NUV61141.1 hypothetical protein [Streptomyces sp. CAI-85]